MTTNDKQSTTNGVQNKANSNLIQSQTNPISQRPKLSATVFTTKPYGNRHLWGINPIQTQFLKESIMSVSPILTKDYQNKRYDDLKRASSLNTRFIGRLRTCETSSDKEVRICSRIDLIRSVSRAIIVNQILKLSLRR